MSSVLNREPSKCISPANSPEREPAPSKRSLLLGVPMKRAEKEFAYWEIRVARVWALRFSFASSDLVQGTKL